MTFSPRTDDRIAPDFFMLPRTPEGIRREAWTPRRTDVDQTTTLPHLTWDQRPGEDASHGHTHRRGIRGLGTHAATQ